MSKAVSGRYAERDHSGVQAFVHRIDRRLWSSMKLGIRASVVEAGLCCFGALHRFVGFTSRASVHTTLADYGRERAAQHMYVDR